MSKVDFVDDIDPKSFVKNTKKAVVLNLDYYHELKEKANKWDEKETPYKVYDFGLLNTRTREGICKCTGAVSESELYCWKCGQKLDWEE